MCHVRHGSSSPAAVVAGSPTSRGATASAAIGQHYSHRSSFSNSCLACFVICLLLNLEIHHAHCGGVISPTSSVNSSPTDPHLKSSSAIVTPMVLPSDAGNTSSIQVYEWVISMQMVDFVLFALDSERDAVRVLYARNSSRAVETQWGLIGYGFKKILNSSDLYR